MAPRITVLIVRDPDGGDETMMWVDGERFRDWQEVTVDAGRGHMVEDWQESKMWELDHAPAAARQVIRAAYDSPPGERYIDGRPESQPEEERRNVGTRGFITFVVDGVEKTTYNHFDSYPGGLGDDVLRWLTGELEGGHEELVRQQADALLMVDEDGTASEEQFVKLAQFADLKVSSQDPREWYVLLREAQGRPGTLLEIGYATSNSDFPRDSLFAEWGYVVDFDERKLEAYRGFQSADAKVAGRFAERGGMNDEWGPVNLVQGWSFDELPAPEEFVAVLEPPESGE